MVLELVRRDITHARHVNHEAGLQVVALQAVRVDALRNNGLQKLHMSECQFATLKTLA